MLAAAIGLVALIPLLAGCDKPKPTITVLSNGDATVVPAQPSCSILPTNPCALDDAKVRTVKANGGTQILLDLAPELADNGYVITAFTSDGKTNTPVSTPGASTGPQKKLTVRLAVPVQAAGGSYFLQLSALPPSTRFTTYLIRVNVPA